MKKKILIIDDEESIRGVLKDSLEYEGYNVMEAINSEEALRKARSILPDLIILDLGIPSIGGLEVCRILRKDEKTKTIPIIILTVRSREVDKVIGLELLPNHTVTLSPPSHEPLIITLVLLTVPSGGVGSSKVNDPSGQSKPLYTLRLSTVTILSAPAVP